MHAAPINARVESAAPPNTQLLIHSKVMALNHVLALQKLETVVPPLKPVTVQDVEEFSARPDQTQGIKQEQ